jgi:phasin family protein
MTENLLSFATVNPAVVEALVRANRAVAHGFEQLSKQCIETWRQSLEDSFQLPRRFAGVANPTEFANLQNQVAQEAWQSIWSRGREWSDVSTSVAREVVASFNGIAGESEPTIKATKRAA